MLFPFIKALTKPVVRHPGNDCHFQTIIHVEHLAAEQGFTLVTVIRGAIRCQILKNCCLFFLQ